MFLTQRNSDTDFTLSQGEHPGWIRMHQHETCHNGVTRTLLKCMILTYRTADVTLAWHACDGTRFLHNSVLRLGKSAEDQVTKAFAVAATSYIVFDRLLVRIWVKLAIIFVVLSCYT